MRKHWFNPFLRTFHFFPVLTNGALFACILTPNSCLLSPNSCLLSPVSYCRKSRYLVKWGAVTFIFRRKMTKWEAFWGGFWSVWEIRSFGEKPTFRPCEPFDYQKVREELGYNKPVWERIGRHFDRVGGYIRTAMGTMDEEIKRNDGDTHTKQDA